MTVKQKKGTAKRIQEESSPLIETPPPLFYQPVAAKHIATLSRTRGARHTTTVPSQTSTPTLSRVCKLELKKLTLLV